MSTQVDIAKPLKKVTAKLEKGFASVEDGAVDAAATPAAPEDADAGVHDLVYAFLLWEAGSRHALAALERIKSATADLNDFRVCSVDEMHGLLGAGYPMANERIARLRLTLRDIFNREHALAIDRLSEAPKREAAAYLDGLDAIPGFVAARVALLRFGAHAVPVDRRLAGVLADDGVVDDSAPDDPRSLASKLERAIRAGDAEPFYLSLERFSATRTPPRSRKRATGEAKTKKKAAARRTR